MAKQVCSLLVLSWKGLLGSCEIQKILFLKNRTAFQSQDFFSKSIIKHYKKTSFWRVLEDQREMEGKSGASLTSQFFLEDRFGLALCTVSYPNPDM